MPRRFLEVDTLFALADIEAAVRQIRTGEPVTQATPDPELANEWLLVSPQSLQINRLRFEVRCFSAELIWWARQNDLQLASTHTGGGVLNPFHVVRETDCYTVGLRYFCQAVRPRSRSPRRYALEL